MPYKGALVFLLAAACLPAATVDIGTLQLQNVSGFQTLFFFNNTGSTAGCSISYPVCNGINIKDWSVTFTFTNEFPLDPANDPPSPSPLTFTSSVTDVINPYDGVTAYGGGTSGTWQISLDLNEGGANCPPCDYQITQIDMTGTIDSAFLPLQLFNGQPYNSGDPSTFTVFNAQPVFSATWTIPSSDYTGLSDPLFFFDAADVFANDQPLGGGGVPEPGSMLLMAAGAGLLMLKRRFRRS